MAVTLGLTWPFNLLYRPEDDFVDSIIIANDHKSPSI